MTNGTEKSSEMLWLLPKANSALHPSRTMTVRQRWCPIENRISQWPGLRPTILSVAPPNDGHLCRLPPPSDHPAGPPAPGASLRLGIRLRPSAGWRKMRWFRKHYILASRRSGDQLWFRSLSRSWSLRSWFRSFTFCSFSGIFCFFSIFLQCLLLQCFSMLFL